ncbi:AAA family ATPase [uncultured Muribaculum sp.]|uniref:AAA family ATPase n=1 Tax=uncultured Muribaculum sp. TaxID=1918613 RepID=UPI002599E823|nr:AAA family ATPase [uncultured Muribaculum sp.]
MLFKRHNKIGNYTVISPIKKGTYAETYRVNDLHGTKRFLKLINTPNLKHWQTDDAGNIIEVEVTKSLHHNNLCSFVDAGALIIGGQKYFYLVTEFVSNETLAESIEHGREYNIYEIKQICIAILSALKYLHSLPRPIIHNEVTIQNIILDLKTDDLKDVKLIDFGYSRYLDQPNSKQSLEDLNVFYLAPERFAGVSCVQSDLYAVGVCLYLLVYERLPWFFDLGRCTNEEKIDKLCRHRERPLNLPHVDIFELDEQLINTIKKALLPNVQDRFQSADDFIAALEGSEKVENPDLTRQVRMEGDGKSKAVSKTKTADGEGFSAIAGMQELKDMVKVEVIDAINQREEYERYGVTIPNGMLLYGPPGCGKTFFAKQLAAEVGFNFMVKKPSDLQSRYVNATQENIAAMFKEAEENAPTIIFLDEMNELTPNRDRGDIHQMHISAVNELLANMDRLGEKGVFVIGATNYPHLMDPAILRSGRLDKKFYVAPPDFDARKAMFEMLLKKRPYDFGLDYDRLARLTENYVFSDLTLIINDASRKALMAKSKITMTILEETIRHTKSSLSSSDIEKYNKIKAQMEGREIEKTRPRVGF